MKLSTSTLPAQRPIAGLLLATIGSLFHQMHFQAQNVFAQAETTTTTAHHHNHHSTQSRLIDKCCLIGKERAVESSKFNCKLSAREALVGSQPASARSGSLLALAAESLLARDPNFADQCEMVLESCCMGHHRTKNCDSGKQFARSGAACMDVELSKEATMATESFNDCCMSCSLGILAAKNPAANESLSARPTRQSLAARCKLISPLASSLSGQLYEQTYTECCQENLPRLSSTLVVRPGAPIDCDQSNPCSQRCLSAGSSDSSGGRRVEQDRCDCFAGYKLASDGISCVDIDECKLGQHSCGEESICDNLRGSFRCLTRSQAASSSWSSSSSSASSHSQHHFAADPAAAADSASGAGSGELGSEFISMRLCPLGSRWNSDENRCQPTTAAAAAELRSASSRHLHHHQARSASLSASPASGAGSGLNHVASQSARSMASG